MTARNFVNNAPVATLTPSGINASAAVFQLSTTTGYPAVPFTAVLDDGTPSSEVVLVNNVSGLQVSVTRGYNGSSAVSHSLGATFQHEVIALDLQEANDHINATTNVHGFTGSIVGTTGAQTITQKNLTASGGTATTTAPAFTLDSTASDAGLLLGRKSGVTVASIDHDGNTAQAGTMAVGSTTLPTTAMAEVTSSTTKVPVRGKGPATTIGLQANATSGTAHSDIYPGRIVLATDQAVTPLDVTPSGSSPLIATLKNSSGSPVTTVGITGDVTTAGTLSSTGAIFTSSAVTATGNGVFGGTVTADALLLTVYADAAARDAALPSPANGTVAYVTSIGLQIYQFGAWTPIPAGYVMYSFLASGFASTRSTGSIVVQTGFSGITSIQLYAGRLYRIFCDGRCSSDTAGTAGDIYLRGIAGASAPGGATGTQLRRYTTYETEAGGVRAENFGMTGLFKVTTSGLFSFCIAVVQSGGPGDFGLHSSTGDGVLLTIEDVGPTISGVTTIP